MTGEGTARAGGRWSSKGTKIVYASESLALAVLEIVTNARGRIPPGKVYLTIDVPEDLRLERVSTDGLAPRWYAYPAPPPLARIGDEWARRGKTVGLVVPSAIVRVEHNMLLNPSHRDFDRLMVSAPRDLPAIASLRT